VPLRAWVISLLALFFANLLLALWPTPEVARLSYTDFVQQERADNLKTALFQGETITGEFIKPVKGQTAYITQQPQPDPTLVRELIDHKVQVAAAHSPFDWLGNLFNLLSAIAMLGLFVSIAYQLRTGQRMAIGVGQSRARVYTEERPNVSFADVAGNEEAKADLQEIIDFLKDASRYRRLGAKIPRGVLLVGPPGTGKTLMARAVAGEANVPFFSVSATEFIEMFVGVGAARIRDLFQKAKSVAPCIVFVDEIDSIGRARSGMLSIGGNDEREQTLNQLLVEMDGFEPNQGVIVLAATNRPDILDPALLRPGRFDRRVEVGLPDRVARLAILRLHGSKVPLAADVDLEAIARRTPGFSGADLANLINEAALSAARANRDSVTKADLDEAFEKVVLGARRRLAMTDEDRRRVAVHEAGHALVAYYSPGADPPDRITIVPHGRALGVTQFGEMEDRVNLPAGYLKARLAVALGGRAAEQLIYNEPSTGAENDLKAATTWARNMVERWGMGEEVGPVSLARDGEMATLWPGQPGVGLTLASLADKAVQQLLRAADRNAGQILMEHRPILERLRDVLVERETIDRSDLERLASGKELAAQTDVGGGTAEAGAREVSVTSGQVSPRR
jgi:cell division protease FtsH